MKSLQDKSVARRHAFSPAEEHVFTLMSKDSYPRFLRSQIYKGVLSAAQQQVILVKLNDSDISVFVNVFKITVYIRFSLRICVFRIII